MSDGKEAASPEVSESMVIASARIHACEKASLVRQRYVEAVRGVPWTAPSKMSPGCLVASALQAASQSDGSRKNVLKRSR